MGGLSTSIEEKTRSSRKHHPSTPNSNELEAEDNTSTHHVMVLVHTDPDITTSSAGTLSARFIHFSCQDSSDLSILLKYSCNHEDVSSRCYCCSNMASHGTVRLTHWIFTKTGGIETSLHDTLKKTCLFNSFCVLSFTLTTFEMDVLISSAL